MPGIDWEYVARGVLHPLQIAILERAAEAPDQRFSPVDLATALDVPLGNASYHVRVLLERGLIRRAGTTPRRGAIQHHYRAADQLIR